MPSYNDDVLVWEDSAFIAVLSSGWVNLIDKRDGCFSVGEDNTWRRKIAQCDPKTLQNRYKGQVQKWIAKIRERDMNRHSKCQSLISELEHEASTLSSRWDRYNILETVK